MSGLTKIGFCEFCADVLKSQASWFLQWIHWRLLSLRYWAMNLPPCLWKIEGIGAYRTLAGRSGQQLPGPWEISDFHHSSSGFCTVSLWNSWIMKSTQGKHLKIMQIQLHCFSWCSYWGCNEMHDAYRYCDGRSHCPQLAECYEEFTAVWCVQCNYSTSWRIWKCLFYYVFFQSALGATRSSLRCRSAMTWALQPNFVPHAVAAVQRLFRQMALVNFQVHGCELSEVWFCLFRCACKPSWR